MHLNLICCCFLLFLLIIILVCYNIKTAVALSFFLLQIPTSFRFRRSTEQDHRRGRGRASNHDSSVDQLTLAIQASLETANVNETNHDQPPSSSSSNSRAISYRHDSDPLIQPFESSTVTDSESSSRYRQALGNNPRNVPLEESSFPPLATAPSSSIPKSKEDLDGLPKNTMAARLRGHGKATVVHSGQAWAAPNRGPVLSSSSSTQPKVANIAPVSSSMDHVKLATSSGPASNSYASFAQARPTTAHGFASTISSTSGSTSRISHSLSAPNLVDGRSLDSSVSDFPPVSAIQKQKLPTISQSSLNSEAVHSANKSLVEKMRAALDFDEDKYTAFKDISGQYRQGSINTAVYLAYVQEFGLSHLVLELARLCPDAQKQKELLETFNASVRINDLQENGWGPGNVHFKEKKTSKRGKEKAVVVEAGRVKDTLADSIISTVRNLQSTLKPSEEEAEVLSKDGYRGAKGKSKKMVEEHIPPDRSSSREPLPKLSSHNELPSAGVGSNQNTGPISGGGGQRRKKSSKFLRARLGDGSVGALLNHQDLDPDPDPVEETLDANRNAAEGLPVHGAWRGGGGQRLFSK